MGFFGGGFLVQGYFWVLTFGSIRSSLLLEIPSTPSPPPPPAPGIICTNRCERSQRNQRSPPRGGSTLTINEINGRLHQPFLAILFKTKYWLLARSQDLKRDIKSLQSVKRSLKYIFTKDVAFVITSQTC